MRTRLLALTIALACGAAALVGVSSASADEASPPNPTYGDIRLRDVLILDQENLLNAYRCRFNVDTSVVSVGCMGQAPTRALSIRHTVGHYSIYWDGLTWGNFRNPKLFEDDRPTSRQELLTRERLISAQELLLNKYRCLFNIDLEIVPTDCTAFLSTVIEPGTVGPQPGDPSRITYMGPVSDLVAPVPMDADWVSKYRELVEVTRGLTGEEVRRGDVAAEVQPLSQALFCLPEQIAAANCMTRQSGFIAQTAWQDLVNVSHLACPASDGVTIWELVQSHDTGVWMEGGNYEWAGSLWLPDWLPDFQSWSTINGHSPETNFVCFHRSDPRYLVLYLDDVCFERFIHIENLPNHSTFRCFPTRYNTLVISSDGSALQHGQELSAIWKQRLEKLHQEWCERFPGDCPSLEYLRSSVG